MSVGSVGTFAEAVRKVAEAIDPDLSAQVDPEAESVVQQLYNAEIDGRVGRDSSGLWWALGDDWNGVETQGKAGSVADAVSALARAALHRFPQSSFARASSGAPWRP